MISDNIPKGTAENKAKKAIKKSKSKALSKKTVEKRVDIMMSLHDHIQNFYETKGYNELTSFIQLLEDAEISEYCMFSPKVVRGLDYYTGIVYEVFDTGKENSRSIFGGGRYDDLLSLFSDEKITGTGFGKGVLMFSLFLKTYNTTYYTWNLLEFFVFFLKYQKT